MTNSRYRYPLWILKIPKFWQQRSVLLSIFSDISSQTFFRYQIFPIPVPSFFTGTKFVRYRLRDFFPVPICSYTTQKWKVPGTGTSHSGWHKSRIIVTCYPLCADRWTLVREKRCFKRLRWLTAILHLGFAQLVRFSQLDLDSLTRLYPASPGPSWNSSYLYVQRGGGQ